MESLKVVVQRKVMAGDAARRLPSTYPVGPATIIPTTRPTICTREKEKGEDESSRNGEDEELTMDAFLRKGEPKISVKTIAAK